MNPPFPAGSGAQGHLGTRQLRVQVDHLEEQRLCVRVAGELDLATTEELTSMLTELLSGPRNVVLDLSGVAFMDSTGLAAIVAAIHQAELVGAQLEFASPLPPQPQHLLELTGILGRLSFTVLPPQPPA